MTTYSRLLLLTVLAAAMFACGAAEKPIRRIDLNAVPYTPLTSPPPIDPELALGNANASATYQLVTPNTNSRASGVAVTEDGWFLTDWHAVDGDIIGPYISVWDNTGKPRVRNGTTHYIDFEHDLALVKFDTIFPATVTFGSMSDLKLGARVYNFSYPYEFGMTVMRGSLASLDWTPHTETKEPHPNFHCLLVDMNINHGSSGSGIFLEKSGLLIGLEDALHFQGKGRDTMRLQGIVRLDFILDFLRRHDIRFHQGTSGK